MRPTSVEVRVDGVAELHAAALNVADRMRDLQDALFDMQKAHLVVRTNEIYDAIEPDGQSHRIERIEAEVDRLRLVLLWLADEDAKRVDRATRRLINRAVAGETGPWDE